MATAAKIYRAPHLTQRVSSDPYWPFNCGAYSLARATNAATVGGLKITGRAVRALSSEPIPDPRSPGLNIPQLVAVSKQLRVPITDKTGGTWADVVAVLDIVGAGRRVIANIDYAAWSERCQDRNIDFGHALTLDAVRKVDGVMQVLASDPLCDRLQWYRAGNVRDAMLAWGRKIGLPAGQVAYAVTRAIPLIAVET